MISVIIPVYNGEKDIKACLDSILTQTDTDLEILVTDDGSEDSTLSVCRKIAAEDSRVRLFHQENAGVSAARNRGLGEAKGEYVTFVDADDLLPPNAIAALRRGMGTDTDFVIGSHSCFRGRWERQVTHTPAEPPDALASLMCGKLYRRSLIEENGIRFREGLPYGEDTVFNLQYYKCARKVTVLETVVYRCRMGGIASSLRHYPDRDKIALSLIGAYGRFFGGTGKIPERILQRELTETCLHYLVHESPREARERLDGMLAILPPCGFSGGEEVVRLVRRSRWRRIVLRKIKKRIKGFVV